MLPPSTAPRDCLTCAAPGWRKAVTDKLEAPDAATDSRWAGEEHVRACERRRNLVT